MARRDRRPPAPGRQFTAAGLRLHAVESGVGDPAVLLLHGYLSSTAIWDDARLRLSEHLRTLALDLPGCGYSDRPADAPYDLPWLADVVLAAVDALGLERVVLGGHSLGAAVAIHAAVRAPDRLAGLVLVSPPAYAPPPPPGLRLARHWPGVMRAFFASPLGRAAIPPLIRRAGFAGRDVEVRQRTERLLAHLDAPGGWAAATTMGLQLREHSPDAALLERISCPALVVWGELDRVHPPAAARLLCGDLGGETRLEQIAGAGHNVHEEAAGGFADALRRWSASLSDQ
jgi:pimeloyl-ACP methyl ester carboxylesterase